jgi:protein-S-isoprenylcysteine O-methyltransferase Ste14
MVIVISVLLGIFAGLQTYGRSAFHIYFYWTGIVLIVSGLTIRWIAIFRLKKQFTVDVAIGKESKIVKEGIYKYIRHPSYTGSLLSFLGLGTAFANYFSMAVIFIPILLAFLYRIKIEETALMEAFGEEYRQYSARAKKLIPGIY